MHNLNFAATKMFGGTKKKEKNCKKGTPCGFTCISEGKKCRNPLNDAQKKKIEELKSLRNKEKTKPSVERVEFKTEEVKDRDYFHSWNKEIGEIEEVRDYYVNKATAERLKKQITESLEDQKKSQLKDRLFLIQKQNDTISKQVKKSKYFDVPVEKLTAAMNVGSIVIDHSVGYKNSYGIGIKDSKGIVQGGLIYSKERGHIYVEYLATAPWNILEKGKDERTVKGAGTEAITQAIKISKKEGFEGRLKLQAVPSALDFYKKLGFEGDVTEMQLSPKSAEALLKKHELKNPQLSVKKKKLTLEDALAIPKEQRPKIIAVYDSFKEKNAPYVMESGPFRDFKRYTPEAYSDDYLVRSENSNQKARYYARMSDGSVQGLDSAFMLSKPEHYDALKKTIKKNNVSKAASAYWRLADEDEKKSIANDDSTLESLKNLLPVSSIGNPKSVILAYDNHPQWGRREFLVIEGENGYATPSNIKFQNSNYLNDAMKKQSEAEGSFFDSEMISYWNPDRVATVLNVKRQKDVFISGSSGNVANEVKLKLQSS